MGTQYGQKNIRSRRPGVFHRSFTKDYKLINASN